MIKFPWLKNFSFSQHFQFFNARVNPVQDFDYTHLWLIKIKISSLLLPLYFLVLDTHLTYLIRLVVPIWVLPVLWQHKNETLQKWGSKCPLWGVGTLKPKAVNKKFYFRGSFGTLKYQVKVVHENFQTSPTPLPQDTSLEIVHERFQNTSSKSKSRHLMSKWALVYQYNMPAILDRWSGIKAYYASKLKKLPFPLFCLCFATSWLV